jgi:DNA-binding MarR family transcriptional regulator
MTVNEDQRAEIIDRMEWLFQEMNWRGRRRLTHLLETSGLTVPQYITLSMIGKLGPNVTMRELSDALQLPASTMTSIADRLVKDDLVERGALPTDRRAVAATLTAAGSRLVEHVEAQRHADLEMTLEGFDNDDLATFMHLLTRLLEGVDRTVATSNDAEPSRLATER